MRVGGQMFEVSKAVLCLDPNSLLAALCNGGPGREANAHTHTVHTSTIGELRHHVHPVPPPPSHAHTALTINHHRPATIPDESPLEVDREDQVVVVDRDWWLFR